MSPLYIDSFANPHRPEPLNASDMTIHSQHLSQDFVSRFSQSLSLPANSEGHLLASSSRLWESILEEHGLPFLILKVADMRMHLGSEVTALMLYEEVFPSLIPRSTTIEYYQTQLQDSSGEGQFGLWLKELRSSVMKKANKTLILYKEDPLGNFPPKLRWVPTASDPFPTCTVNPDRLRDLDRLWKNIEHGATDWRGRFRNTICLETNYIEGTFHFDTKDHDILTTDGFYEMTTRDKLKRGPIGGAVRNLEDVIAILHDTSDALNEIYSFLGPNPPKLTVDLICAIHRKLMKTSRVLYNESGAIGHLSYVNIGVTRQASCSNVMAWSNSGGGKPSAVQFCPHDEVDAELAIFCERFNEIIKLDGMDAYACAAWISHVFVAIHPFEDGNGRLSRILSSIPLVRKGFPPVNVSLEMRDTYFAHLNNVRK